MLLTSDTEILREVMVKDFSKYPNRRVGRNAPFTNMD